MASITVNFAETIGRIKPMHAVNNGPVHNKRSDQSISNMTLFAEAGIPFARNHDAAFLSNYGGEHIVDVNFIFRDFDADENNPDCYDFHLTDEYIENIVAAGSEVFYRLGSKIEHWTKKYNTLPPTDFGKWARICEHIIRHYTEGWANGFCYDIKYWEIWNEPDLDTDEDANKRTWGGTKAQFFELYDITARHLKSCFPHLKIGGPALAFRLDWAEEFLAQLTAPLDFFSWHRYGTDVAGFGERARQIRALLDRYGFEKTESILNEYNYITGWTGQAYIDSLEAIRGMRGAAFTAAVMCEGQNGCIDMEMYYDARPSNFCGMFDRLIVSRPCKGYYPFRMFNELYRQRGAVEVTGDHADFRAVASSDGNGKGCVLAVHYGKNAQTEPLRICFDGLGEAKTTVGCYLLDAAHDCDKMFEFAFEGGRGEVCLDCPPDTVWLFKIN